MDITKRQSIVMIHGLAAGVPNEDGTVNLFPMNDNYARSLLNTLRNEPVDILVPAEWIDVERQLTARLKVDEVLSRSDRNGRGGRDRSLHEGNDGGYSNSGGGLLMSAAGLVRKGSRNETSVMQSDVHKDRKVKRLLFLDITSIVVGIAAILQIITGYVVLGGVFGVGLILTIWVREREERTGTWHDTQKTD